MGADGQSDKNTEEIRKIESLDVEGKD